MKGKEEEIKIGYLRLDGSTSTAYIGEDSGVGIDKYTDDDVRLVWDGYAQEWRQVS